MPVHWDVNWQPDGFVDRDRVLPLLKQACVEDASLPEGFAAMLQGLAPDLEREMTEALRSDPPGDWLGPWRLLRAACILLTRMSRRFLLCTL